MSSPSIWELFSALAEVMGKTEIMYLIRVTVLKRWGLLIEEAASHIRRGLLVIQFSFINTLPLLVQTILGSLICVTTKYHFNSWDLLEIS